MGSEGTAEHRSRGPNLRGQPRGSRGIEAGMGWAAAMDLERLRPARMSQRHTSFSRDVISQSALPDTALQDH